MPTKKKQHENNGNGKVPAPALGLEDLGSACITPEEEKIDTTSLKEESAQETPSPAIQQEPQETPAEELTEEPPVEELLRQSRRETRAAKSEEAAAGAESKTLKQKPKAAGGSSTEEGAIAPTAKDTLTAKTVEAVENLLEADSKAKLERIQTGIERGVEHAKDILRGEELGTLLTLTTGTKKTAFELKEQLRKLRQHTDATSADSLDQTLDKLIAKVQSPKSESEQDKPNPLEQAFSNFDLESSFSIFSKED